MKCREKNPGNVEFARSVIASTLPLNEVPGKESRQYAVNQRRNTRHDTLNEVPGKESRQCRKREPWNGQG